MLSLVIMVMMMVKIKMTWDDDDDQRENQQCCDTFWNLEITTSVMKIMYRMIMMMVS